MIPGSGSSRYRDNKEEMNDGSRKQLSGKAAEHGE